MRVLGVENWDFFELEKEDFWVEKWGFLGFKTGDF